MIRLSQVAVALGLTMGAIVPLAEAAYEVDRLTTHATSKATGGDYTLVATIGQPLVAESAGSGYTWGSGFWGGGMLATPVGVPTEASILDVLFVPSSPNPFRAQTTVTFDVDEAQLVSVVVHDVRGRAIATLMNGPVTAGSHTLTWGGRDNSGRLVAPGVYFLRGVTANTLYQEKLHVVR